MYSSTAFLCVSLLARSAVVVTLGGIIVACGSNRPIVADTTPISARDTVGVGEIDSLYVPDGVTPNPLESTTEEGQDAVALAERLSRLDALIRNAPADSVELLRREYEQALTQYTGEDRSADTGPIRVNNPAMRALRNEATYEPIDSFLSARQNHRPVSATTPERSADETSASHSRPRTDPARRIRDSDRTRTTVRSAATTKAPVGDGPRLARQSRRGVAQERSGSRRTGKRLFIDGLVSARAGRYELASEQLPVAVGSADLTTEHRSMAAVVLGESLEALGASDRAAGAYARASERSSGVRDRGVVGRCRALSKAGRRGEARRLLVTFIRKNPRSAMIIAARKLLQTL